MQIRFLNGFCLYGDSPVSAIRRRLVVTAIDRQAREVAIEQCPGASVTEDRNVLVGRGLRDDPINGAYDPRLGVGRRLPTADALFRTSKGPRVDRSCPSGVSLVRKHAEAYSSPQPDQRIVKRVRAFTFITISQM